MKTRLALSSTLLTLTLACPIWAQPPGGPPARDAARFNPLFRLFDGNQDGVLSAEEITAASKKLAALDKNQDGQVTGDELRAALPMGRGRGPGAVGPAGRPFGPGAAGRPGGGGRQGGPGAGANRVTESDLEKGPLGKDDLEKRILTALEKMREGPRFANVAPNDGRLLRILTETMGAKRVVEIGTSTGESAVWFALALRNTGGHLYTHEIHEGRAAIARANFEKAGVSDLITLIFGDAHDTVKQHTEPIDILFLDADKEGYIDYLNKLLPVLRPGGLVIAHNMNTRQADLRFVKAVTENPELETLILLKEGMGVSVTLKKY